MSYIMCRYVLPCRSECYIKVAEVVCVLERSARGKDITSTN